ncbi:MAG: HRDC domain-containing protein [Desulfobacterales bacterium]
MSGSRQPLETRAAEPFLWVETEAALCAFAREIASAPVLGVDLEADSLHHFHEKACLLQIAAPTRHAVVDTLALRDLGCLAPLLRDARIRKVFHGADYDLRLLQRDFGIRVAGLFDTQLACRFLGYPETGLEAALKRTFGVELDKRQRRKDWSLRPLPEAMVAYAAADVRHLVPLAAHLEAELAARGRLAWMLEECRLLAEAIPAAEKEPAPRFLSCKGAGRLDPRGLAVLEALLRLREELARKKDRPPFKVFRTESLLALAEARPRDARGLAESGALSPLQIERYGREVLAAIASALELPEDRLPRYPRRPRSPLNAAAGERLQRLRRWRERKARELGLEPSLVCSKAAMRSLAERKPRTEAELEALAELRPWQRAAFGGEILALLQGKG